MPGGDCSATDLSHLPGASPDATSCKMTVSKAEKGGQARPPSAAGREQICSAPPHHRPCSLSPCEYWLKPQITNTVIWYYFTAGQTFSILGNFSIFVIYEFNRWGHYYDRGNWSQRSETLSSHLQSLCRVSNNIYLVIRHVDGSFQGEGVLAQNRLNGINTSGFAQISLTFQKQVRNLFVHSQN